MIKNRTLLEGDVLEKIKEVPDESIDCIISSPPYWGLRDYGVDGQWGLEPDFRDYLKKLQELMNELKRVLKKTGSCWINLGDTYSGGNAHSDWSNCTEEFIGRSKETKQKFTGQIKNHLQAKSRYAIPERFYINCIDNGWIARNHIPWIKENSMPSSVKDRFTNKWESVFFFVKSQKYYFNLDAVREKPKTETKPFNVRVRDAKKGLGQLKLGDSPKAWKMSEEEDQNYDKYGVRKGRGSNNEKLHNRNFMPIIKQDSVLGADGKPKANYKGFNERWKDRKWTPEMGTIAAKHSGPYDGDGNSLNHPNGKNPGDVFKINPRPFPEAHFATFPIDLPLRILKCACPTNGFVLDPFFGSGTVGVAAEQLGLNWIGIELKPDYINAIIKKRLDKYKNNRLTEFIRN